MKAYVVGLLAGGAVLLAGTAAEASPSPSPSPSQSRPPLVIFPVTGGGEQSPEPDPSDPEPGWPGGLPSWPGAPSPSPSDGSSPEESPSGEPSKSAEPSPQLVVPADPPRQPSSTWRPAPPDRDRPGNHDLYADAEDEGAGGRAGGPDDRDSLGFSGGRELLPVLPLGAGLASVGLGLAALAVRMRRRGA